MVCVSGGLDRLQNRKYKNPFGVGDIVKWEGRGPSNQKGIWIGKVVRTFVGIDIDSPNLVRCHVEIGKERFALRAESLTLISRGEQA